MPFKDYLMAFEFLLSSSDATTLIPWMHASRLVKITYVILHLGLTWNRKSPEVRKRRTLLKEMYLEWALLPTLLISSFVITFFVYKFLIEVVNHGLQVLLNVFVQTSVIRLSIET